MLLQLGSTGDDVKTLQTKLGITADGDFGPGTEAAVKAWQTAHNITPDGIVGDVTWSLMFPGQAGKPTYNLQNLKGHIPDVVIAQIPDVAAKFNITTGLRLAHFLAQCGHESGSFTAVQENLNYSASRLRAVFPSYFPTDQMAAAYGGNPQKIGARVYANRMGNGDEASGDGYKYRGRGYIQLTGKNNYSNFGKFEGVDTLTNPDLVASTYPLASAAFFFNSNNLWAICDQGANEATVTAVTKRVNGGTLGLADRLARFNEYYPLLK